MKRKSATAIHAAKYYIDNQPISIAQVARKFGIDRGALGKTIKEYELYTYDGKDGYYYSFSQKELDMVEYFNTHPHVKMLELKRLFDCNSNTDTIKNWMKILGYEYQPHYKYSNNQNAFAKIETEEDAYWLGFITADGYINETNKWLQIGLGEIDLDHIKKFLHYMGFIESEMDEIIKQRHGGAYTGDNVVYSVTIVGKQLVENLKQYGLFQGKSGKEIPYKCANLELDRAYVRGLIDGDGYIRSTQYGVGLVGSLEIVTYVRDFLGERLKWSSYKEKYIHEHGKIYKFAVGGKNISTEIVDYLYKNSNIYLDRKYKLYEQYCRV